MARREYSAADSIAAPLDPIISAHINTPLPENYVGPELFGQDAPLAQMGERPANAMAAQEAELISPNKARLESGHKAELRQTMADLEAMEKFIIVVPPDPLNPKKRFIKVTINDYTHKIMLGYPVKVPEEVYLVLVRNGAVPPQRTQDWYEAPKQDPNVLGAIRNMELSAAGR